MSKKLLIAALLFLGWGAQAQNDVASTVYPGHDGSRAVVVTGLRDGLFNFISADKHYVSGYVTNESGFVYDLQTDKVQTFNDKVMYAYFSPDHYVASLPGENAVPYIYYGKEIQLEHTISGSQSYDNSLSYWNAQPNGGRVVVLAYEWDYGYKVDSTGNRTWDSVTNPVGAIYNGQTGKVETLLHSYWPRLDPLNHADNVAYRTRANAISADGLVVGGHGTWPTSQVISVDQTMFWDLVDLETKDTVYTYAIEDTRFSLSDLAGANSDGSVLVGYNEETEHGLIIHYNRAQRSFTIDTISPLPGYNQLLFNTVDDNGIIFGFCGISGAPTIRKAVVYSEMTKLLDLTTYLYEYYDISVPEDLGCPWAASPDGSTVAGFYYDAQNYGRPWILQFGKERIRPRVRNVVAKAASTGLIARVDWLEPLASEHELTGYKIYRDNIQEPLAEVDANTLTFTDDQSAMSAGNHVYYIVAVYKDGDAGRTASNTVMTIAEGESFPVQQIDHQLKYNRYASIYWGLPSSEVVSNILTANTRAKEGQVQIDRAPATAFMPKATPMPTSDAKYTNLALDFVYNVDMQMYNGYSGIKIGDKYYVASWQGDGIRIINQHQKIEEQWLPAGLKEAVMSMVYFNDKEQLYCGGLEKVYVINMKNKSVINSFDCPARHLSYLEDFEFNGTKGVLLAGGWDSSAFYTIDGKYLGTGGFDFKDLSVTGTAYHKGKLYVASQSGKYQNEIYTFDVATRKRLGEPLQIMEDPAVYNLLSINGEVTSTTDLAVAGGMSICTLDDGTVVLASTYQCSYIPTQLMFLELESPADRRGYTLYRNGEILAENLSSRHYTDELSAAGTYEYKVKAFSTNGEAPLSPATTLKINAQGNCLPVKDLTARETNRWVALNWNVPTSDTAAGIVGFTVLRDGVKLQDLWDEDVAVFYNDISDLKLKTPYTYRVETLYSNGCKSADSVKITLTDEGVAMAPFGLRVNFTKNTASTADNKLFDATAQWETPLFEEPLSIGYGTGQMISFASFGEDVPTNYWALIGWDAEDLTLYKDLYLVGMEYLLGDDTRSFEAVVYLNEQQAHRETLKRTQAKAWQTMYFSKSFSMNQPKEVLVGYHITYDMDKAPIAIDFSANKRFYSDIISWDGKAWYCLADNNIPGSWALRGLVARKRDIEAATANGVLNPALLEGKIIRLEQPVGKAISLKPTTERTMAMPSPKAPLTLKGFNLYRQRVDIDNQNEIQLNSELMTTFSYKEAAPLPEGDYDYTVEAVYTTTTKPATLSVTLSDVSTEDELNGMTLTLYPNPASETVYVNGDYSRMEILDLGGRVLRRLPAASQIDLNGLTPGTYFFRFTDEAGRKATYKVVVK